MLLYYIILYYIISYYIVLYYIILYYIILIILYYIICIWYDNLSCDDLRLSAKEDLSRAKGQGWFIKAGLFCPPADAAATLCPCFCWFVFTTVGVYGTWNSKKKGTKKNICSVSPLKDEKRTETEVDAYENILSIPNMFPQDETILGPSRTIKNLSATFPRAPWDLTSREAQQRHRFPPHRGDEVQPLQDL